jgi:hypothetical protein
MLTTELPELDVDARPAPARYRREFYLTALIMMFTMAQVWAFMVVLSTVHPTGPARVALLLTLVGAVITVASGWRHILRRSRNHIDQWDRI